MEETDTRPADPLVETVAAMKARIDDLESTLMARVGRRPTGDIEPTLRSTPKPDTLFLQGGTVSRTTYAALWQWVQDNNLIIPGLFTTGDGSTTFGLPNFAGRVLVGVGTLSPDTYSLGQIFGSARHVLTIAELAAHTHSGSTNRYEHDHSGVSHYGGNHGGHVNSQVGRTSGADFAAHPSTSGSGEHRHGIPNDGHSHSMSLNNTGNNSAHENRQPSIAINYLVWT